MRDCLIDTPSGAVQGAALEDIKRFLAIPYAAPPVDELRFALPSPVRAWSGVRDATRRGATSPQIIRAFTGLDITPLVGHGWQRGDDFLTLNIWTPAEAAEHRPVLVFIHGGAFVAGSSNAAVHDGSEFARSGIVYAAINYRLGAEGFLPIAGAPTNLGLRDQIAALRWVKHNIGAFGGDPASITVAGESAGAMSLADLIASPLARGLFHRAILQSGHGSMVRPIETAARMTQRLAAHLGVSADRAGFCGRSLEETSAAVDAMSRPEVGVDLKNADGFDPGFGLARYLPVIGDEVLPRAPLEALADGAGAEVDLLIGTNREEMNLYFVPTGVKDGMSAEMAERVLSHVHPHAREILSAYAGAGRSPGGIFVEAMTDLVFRGPARRFAAAHRGRAHLYEFGWRSPACGGALGACHGLELPFVFKTLEACQGPTGILGPSPPPSLAHDVHRVWVEFAGHGRLPWPAYDLQSRTCFRLESAASYRDPDIPAGPFQ